MHVSVLYTRINRPGQKEEVVVLKSGFIMNNQLLFPKSGLQNKGFRFGNRSDILPVNF